MAFDGRKMRLAISFTASRGVQCSPASSLFSSLNFRTSSQRRYPLSDYPWQDVSRTVAVDRWFGLRLMSGSSTLNQRSRESDFDSVGIWLRNLKFSRMSERWAKAIEVRLEVLPELLLIATRFQIPRVNFDVL